MSGLLWEQFGLVVCSPGILMSVSLLCVKTCEMTFTLGSRCADAGCSPSCNPLNAVTVACCLCHRGQQCVIMIQTLAAAITTQSALIFSKQLPVIVKF